LSHRVIYVGNHKVVFHGHESTECTKNAERKRRSNLNFLVDVVDVIFEEHTAGTMKQDTVADHILQVKFFEADIIVIILEVDANGEDHQQVTTVGRTSNDLMVSVVA